MYSAVNNGLEQDAFDRPANRWRGSIALAAVFVGVAAHAACPTANSGFTAYQADIDLDGVPDILFRPKPLVIVVPLGADDDLIPLALDPGLPGFNVVSGGGSGAPLGPVPANAVVVPYQATVMTGEAGSCGLVSLRSTTAGLPTLIVSFGTGAPGASTTPKLVQTLASSASASTKTTYTYDARNRLVGTTYGDGSPSISRSYTPDGLLASISSNGSTWSYGYNRRRLLQQETLSFGGSSYGIGRSYDANGHLSQLSYPDGTAVGYSPNALGQPSQVSGYASAVSWHPNGALAGFTYANGIAHTLTQNTRGLPQQSTDAGVIQDQYTFDANANVTAITDALQGVSTRGMGYDALDRLTIANSTNVWGSGSYAYDPLDNLRASTVGGRNTAHNYDSANRLASLMTNGTLSALSYDAQGNVSAKGSRNYIFDQGNRLLASGSSSYTYDGLGLRTAATGSDGKRRVQVYGSSEQLLYGSLTPASGAPSAIRYIYLSGSVIAETDSAGTTYLHSDGLGSPIARTNSAKAVTSRTRYEPYGAAAAGTNPGTGVDNLGFTGHANDADTGLVYMQQRYYDPVAGRFLSNDPLGASTNGGRGFNRYAYARNSPYGYVDPDGRLEVIPLPGQLIEGRRGRSDDPFNSTVRSSISAGRDSGRATMVAAGMAVGGFVGNVAAGWCTVSTGGVCAAGWGGIVGLGVAGGGLLGSGAYSLAEWVVVLATGADSADKPTGVPDNWLEEPTKGDGGRQWVNPDNSGDRVRVMPGNPDSPNPGQREPYVRDVRNGNQWLDVNGNRIEGKTGRNSPDTHVPVKDYVFRP